MKKLPVVMLLLMMLPVSAACGAKSPESKAKTEIMSEDYGNAVILAQNEIQNTFSEHDGIEITETSTMIRTNDSNRLVVQFSYLSNNGNGVYGYEIVRDAYGNFEVIQQGEDVTIDNLVKEAE